MQKSLQWFSAAFVGLSLATSSVAADIKSVDSIAAVVNDGVITVRQLDSAERTVRLQLPKGSKVSADDIRKSALGRLINQQLMVQAARRAGIQLTPAEIDAEIARIAASGKMTTEQFYKQLAKEGVSRQTLRQTVSDNLLAQKVEQSEVMSKGQVTDAEVDEALRRAKASGRALPPPVAAYTYHAHHILLKGDNEATRKLIAQLGVQLRGGADFSQLAKQYSQDGSAAQGGDLGWLSEGETVAPFEETLKTLKPGEISRPVQTQFGWHIIRLDAVKKNDSPDQQQRNGMRVVLAQEKKAAVLQNLLQQLHEQSYIEIKKH